MQVDFFENGGCAKNISRKGPAPLYCGWLYLSCLTDIADTLTSNFLWYHLVIVQSPMIRI